LREIASANFEISFEVSLGFKQSFVYLICEPNV
jgi:hypothetical protein